jgi:hypothetical protein
MAYPYPPARKKSNKTLLIVLAAALGVCLVCGGIAAGTGVISMLYDNPPAAANRPAAVLAPTKTPARKVIKATPTEEAAAPMDTEEAAAPTATEEAAIQPEPSTEEPAATTSALQTSGTFTDDFSTLDASWPVESTDVYQDGYSQLQNYFIMVLQANRMVYVIPPHHLQPPFANAIISANVKPGAANGGFGFLCGFQDTKNFYAVKVSGTKYSVYKTVQGQVTFLTNPQWLPAEGIENTDQYGQINLLVNCMGSSIGVEINGYGQKMIVDDANSFQAGNVAIFASAGAADGNNAGNTVNFDDFSLQVSNP